MALGICLRGLGKHQDAEKEYQQALSDAPNHPAALFNLALLRADSAVTPATNGKSGAGPAAEAVPDKSAAPVEPGGGAATKAGPGAADTATPPGK